MDLEMAGKGGGFRRNCLILAEDDRPEAYSLKLTFRKDG